MLPPTNIPPLAVAVSPAKFVVVPISLPNVIEAAPALTVNK